MPAALDESTRAVLVRHVIRRGRVSKAELEESLGLSHPTVTNTVAALIRAGVLREDGEYESTGGRKAKAISADPAYRTFGGIDVTQSHVAFIIVDFAGNVVAKQRSRLAYANTAAYYKRLGEAFSRFRRGFALSEVGVSLPGILSNDRRTLVKSHALNVEGLDLTLLASSLDVERVEFENDANAAAQAELADLTGDTIYLTLSNTVGGAVYQDGRLRLGDNRRAGEFGHVTLHPEGRTCYCGRRGCADNYLSALRLAEKSTSLEAFFDGLSAGAPSLRETWCEYLDNLALLVSNIRLSHDCNVMLGGYVGAFLDSRRAEICERLWQLNLFDTDLDFLRIARHGLEASAIGAALHLRDDVVSRM